MSPEKAYNGTHREIAYVMIGQFELIEGVVQFIIPDLDLTFNLTGVYDSAITNDFIVSLDGDNSLLSLAVNGQSDYLNLSKYEVVQVQDYITLMSGTYSEFQMYGEYFTP